MSLETFSQKIKFYKDEQLTQPLDKIIDLDVISAGDVKEFTFWLFNDTNIYFRKIEYTIENEEIKIIQFPNELLPRGRGKVVIQALPNIDIEEEKIETILSVKLKNL